MKLENVFYFKDIVDYYYPDENRAPVDIQKVVIDIQEKIRLLSDEDFIEVIISCFIPDLYSGMGKSEKLFTKLTELMVGEWWRRIGGDYLLPTKKSGTQDVELIYDRTSIVCDAKVFRLGRSQKAPNVKDFLKLASVRLWIESLRLNYKKMGVEQQVIGGLVTYSSLHEWESDSEVYEECTNHDTPVLMLPYEVLALILNHKEKIDFDAFLGIWDYSANHVVTSRQKANYWEYVSTNICKALSISILQYENEIKEFHRRIMRVVKEYRKIVQNTVDDVTEHINANLNEIQDPQELREYALREIEARDNAVALDYLRHIDDFRNYKD